MDQDNSVSWRMAKKRVERTRQEGWVVMVVTSDLSVAGRFLPLRSVSAPSAVSFDLLPFILL